MRLQGVKDSRVPVKYLALEYKLPGHFSVMKRTSFELEDK
jgi:hypothetical protein